jgi:hypothetical protein
MNERLKKFFDLYYINLSNYPNSRQKEIYEITELHYTGNFGRRRYKDYNVFRVRFHYFLKYKRRGS